MTTEEGVIKTIKTHLLCTEKFSHKLETLYLNEKEIVVFTEKVLILIVVGGHG